MRGVKRPEVEPMPDGEGPQPDSVEYWLPEAMRVSYHFMDHTGAGRPSMLADANLVASIMAVVAQGATPSDAAVQLGISPTNFTNWQAKGAARDADAGYLELVELLEKATSIGNMWHVRNIRWHARKNWTASAWWLQRKDPEKYGLKQELNVNQRQIRGPQAAEVRIIPMTADDADRLKLLLSKNEPLPAEPTIDATFHEVPANTDTPHIEPNAAGND